MPSIRKTGAYILTADEAEVMRLAPQLADALNASTAKIERQEQIIKAKDEYIEELLPLVKPPMYNRWLTKSEYDQAQKLAKEGKHIGAAAKIMGRSKDTLRRIERRRGFIRAVSARLAVD